MKTKVNNINIIRSIIYKTDLIVNLQGDLVIDSYFTQPTNLTMNCRIQNYPPTCLYWLKNGTLLSSNAITTLLNASTTLYSSTLMVNSSDELVGNYSCTAVSIRNGTDSTHKSGSSQLLVEGKQQTVFIP